MSAHKILISLVASFFLMPDLHADIETVYICTFFSPRMNTGPPAPTFTLLLLCNNSNAKVETGAQD